MESSGGRRDRTAVASNANGSASALEDAYRRAAANLAAAAWGCEAGQVPPPPPRRRPLSTSASTAFSSVSSTTGIGTGSGAATPLVRHSPTQHQHSRAQQLRTQQHQQQQQHHMHQERHMLHTQHMQHGALTDPDEVDGDDEDDDGDDDYSRSSKVSKSSYDDHGDHHSHATAASSSSQSQSQPHTSQAQAQGQGHGGGGGGGVVGGPSSQLMLRHVAEEEAFQAAPLGQGCDATGRAGGGSLLRRMTLGLRPTYAGALNLLRSSAGDGEGEAAMMLDDERIRPILGAEDDSLPMPPLHMEVDAGAGGVGVGEGVVGDHMGLGAAAVRRGSPHRHGRGAAAAAAAAVASLDGIGSASHGHGRQDPDHRHRPKDGPTKANPDGDELSGDAPTNRKNAEPEKDPLEGKHRQPPSPRQNKEREQKQQKKKKATKEKNTTKKKDGGGSSTTGGKKKCLTTPSEPCSSSSSTTGADHHDNVEGNLIVHVGDLFEVPNSAVHFLSSPETSQSSSPASPSSAPPVNHAYEVIDLLGQGTFAQVFRCRRSDDGTHVAVKVVKNKPAYTRQAAVEIDIFRTLLASEGRQDSVGKGASGSGSGSGNPGGCAAIGLGGSGGGGGGTAATTHDGEMPSSYSQSRRKTRSHWIQLQAYFFYHSHLCLVFELLGLNLYEVLKRRQFRGLKLVQVRDVVRQCLEGMKELAGWGIVHCDVKPENILMVHPPAEEDGGGDEGDGNGSESANGDAGEAMGVVVSRRIDGGSQRGGAPGADSSKYPASSSPLPTAPSTSVSSEIKIIDFGSATYEEPPASTNALLQQYHYQYHTQHTYIQSRFYRSPEVLVGLPYDSAIDMWSLGCVAAELFLGLPILPGMQEHDQLCRICEMIGPLPDWMMDRGSKANKYFFKVESPALSSSGHHHSELNSSRRNPREAPTPPPSQTATKATNAPRWKLKSRSEYALSMQEETGTKVDVHQQPTNRYFKRKKLADIVLLHGHYTTDDEKNVKVFCHFLQGILHPDPWKRWTAQQALLHPFLTGRTMTQRINQNLNETLNFGDSSATGCKFWSPPFDPSICRRKLLCVEKSRDKHTAQQNQQQQASKQLLLERRGLLASGVSGPQLGAVSGGAGTGTVVAPASTLDADDMAAVASVTFSPGRKGLRRGKVISPEFSTSRVTAMTDAMSISSQTIPQSATVVTDGTLAAMASVEDSPSPPPSLSVSTQQRPYYLHGNAGQLGSDGVNNALPRHLPSNGIVSSLGALSTDAFGNGVQQREQISASTQHGLGDVFHQQIHQPQLASTVMATNGTVGWMDYNSSFAASGSNVTTLPSPTIHGISSAYDPSMMPNFHSLPQFLPTPQNASKLYQGQNVGQNLPIEGDLGYALQRPGVVPSMSYANDPQQPYNSLSPHHHAAGSYIYSPQMAPTAPPSSMKINQMNVGSRSSSVSSITSPGRQRDRANCIARTSVGRQLAGTTMTAQGAPMSATSLLPTSSPRSYPMAMHNHLDDSRSQQSSDFMADFGGMTRGGGEQKLVNEKGQPSKSLSSAPTGTRSLLAQQLEQHSALSNNHKSMQESGTEALHRSDGHLANIPHPMHQNQYASTVMYDSANAVPSSVPANPVPYPSQPGYFNYTTTSGTPLMMSAPSASMDLRTTAAGAQLQSNASMLGQAYLPVAAATTQRSFGAYGALPSYPYHMQQPPTSSMLLSQNAVGSPHANPNAYAEPAGVPQGRYADGNHPTQSQSHYYREMSM